MKVEEILANVNELTMSHSTHFSFSGDCVETNKAGVNDFKRRSLLLCPLDSARSVDLVAARKES